MAMMPMMPGPAAPMTSPQMTAPPPMTPSPGGAPPDIFSLLGAGAQPSPMPGGMDPMAVMQQALMQFQQMEQMVQDLARQFPGSDEPAAMILQGLQQWKTQLVVGMAPPAQMMPGAQQMM